MNNTIVALAGPVAALPGLLRQAQAQPVQVLVVLATTTAPASWPYIAPAAPAIHHGVLGALRADLARACGESVLGERPEHTDPTLHAVFNLASHTLLPGWASLPLLLADSSELMARVLGQALARVLAAHTALLVVVTEWDDPAIHRAVQAQHPEAVLALGGSGALAAWLWAARARGAWRVRLVTQGAIFWSAD